MWVADQQGKRSEIVARVQFPEDLVVLDNLLISHVFGKVMFERNRGLWYDA